MFKFVKNFMITWMFMTFTGNDVMILACPESCPSDKFSADLGTGVLPFWQSDLLSFLLTFLSRMIQWKEYILTIPILLAEHRL